MQIVLLKFGKNKSLAPKYMEAHNKWIQQGFDDGVFHCVGSLDIGGGFILVHGCGLEETKDRVKSDPFVVNNIVDVEINNIDVKRTSSDMAYLSS